MKVASSDSVFWVEADELELRSLNDLTSAQVDMVRNSKLKRTAAPMCYLSFELLLAESEAFEILAQQLEHVAAATNLSHDLQIEIVV